MKSLKAPFGKILKEYRAKAGLSQLELALDSDVDRTYISMLERGEKNPTLQVVFRICHALDVAPSQMIKELERRIE